jgi:YtkA-like
MKDMLGARWNGLSAATRSPRGGLAAAGIAAVFLSCSSGGGSSSGGSSGGSNAPSGPCAGPTLTTSASTSGALNVAVCLSQEPAYAGLLKAQLTITTSQGDTPMDGLTLQVVPWMPEMHHGADVAPTVMAEGGGKYLVSNLYLYMPGLWELKTTISGAKTDTANPEFQVQ